MKVNHLNKLIEVSRELQEWIDSHEGFDDSEYPYAGFSVYQNGVCGVSIDDFCCWNSEVECWSDLSFDYCHGIFLNHIREAYGPFLKSKQSNITYGELLPKNLKK